MGRGTSDTGRDTDASSTNGTIRLTRAAIDNWSRFTHASEDLAAARMEMIRALHRSGRVETEPPKWMTSAPDGVSAYCQLPGKVTLLLSRIDHEEYTWQADNCVAPKGVRRQARATGVRRSILSGPALEEALGLSGVELGRRIHLSKHALEQFVSRGGKDPEELREAIVSTGRIVKALPEWADPNRTRVPALLVDLDRDLLAMPLAPPTKGDDGVSRFVAATSISQNWASRALPEIDAQTLRQTVHISSSAARMRAREMGGEVESQRTYLNSLMTG